MGDLLKKTSYFLIPYFLIIGICAVVLAFFSKSAIHLWINNHNSTFADIFFKYYTNVGDGLFVIFIAALMLLYKYGLSFVITVSYLASSLIAQLIKHLIFPGALRPTAYFENTVSLHLAEGVKMYTSHSFPSGHSTSAFALFLMLSIFTQKKWAQVIFLLLAVLVAYSRMYLSQHFLIDVFAGSLIGVSVAVGVYYLYHKNHKSWMDKSLLERR